MLSLDKSASGSQQQFRIRILKKQIVEILDLRRRIDDIALDKKFTRMFC